MGIVCNWRNASFGNEISTMLKKKNQYKNRALVVRRDQNVDPRVC